MNFNTSPRFISALGLDIGRKRIGVAGCDGTGLIATGLTTLQRTSFKQDVAQFRELIEQRQVHMPLASLRPLTYRSSMLMNV